MPKSLSLPLRRWPCCPGPYSRRFTGLLGRPKTFSPMRRSSLYLALVRFVTLLLQFALSLPCPGPHRGAETLHAITASPDVRDQLRTAHLGAPADKVKFSRAGSLTEP